MARWMQSFTGTRWIGSEQRWPIHKQTRERGQFTDEREEEEEEEKEEREEEEDVLSGDKASNPRADFRAAGSGPRDPRSVEYIRLNDRRLLNANWFQSCCRNQASLQFAIPPPPPPPLAADCASIARPMLLLSRETPPRHLFYEFTGQSLRENYSSQREDSFPRDIFGIYTTSGGVC